MANTHIESVRGRDIHIDYTYIPPQKEKYPDTMPISSYIEIDRIYILHKEMLQGVGVIASEVDITHILLDIADDWLINLESEIIEKIEE